MKIDDFLTFEKKHNLFSKKISEFSFWGYIRFELNTKLTYSNNKKNENGFVKKRSLKDVFLFIKRLISGIIQSPYNINCENKILFLQSGISDTLTDGSKICRFTDLIIDEIPYNSQWVSDVLVSNKNRHRIVKYNFEILRIPYYFASLIRYKYFSLKEELYKISNEISKYIYDDFNIEVSIDYLFNLIYKAYIRHKFLLKAYKKFLKKANPKCIIYECYYTVDHMCINEAAREMEIDTIELQHGVADGAHIAYNFIENSKYLFLPSKVYFWGKYWMNSSRLPVNYCKKLVTGFPWYDYNVRNYKHVENNDNVCRILVLSQPTITDQLLNIICELIDWFDTNNFKFNLIYKLHPAEYRNSNFIINKLKIKKNIKIINDSKISIYSLFANSDIQIGLNSAALFEGVYYNLKTYIFDSDVSREYMQVLVDKYDANYFSCSKELFNLISNFKFGFENTCENIFFEGNSIDKIKSNLLMYIQ